MNRRFNAFLYVICAVAITGCLLAAQAGYAQGLKYQDANELAEFGTVNVFSETGGTAPIKSDLPIVDNDALWNYRDFGAATTIYQSGISEDSPILRQTVSGLTPGTNYHLYAVYWTDDDENWTIRAGTSASNMNFYSWTGDSGTSPVPGSTQGLAASTAVWTTPPPPTKDGTIFTERAADPLVMLLGKAGTAAANASGQIDVFVDDNPNAGGPRRSWYDGIAYVEATPATANIAATAMLDRTTGTLTLNNPTSQNLQIKSYRIESATTGALNAATWSTINNGNPSWTVTMPADPANTPFTNLLSEDGGGTNVTLASGGGSLSFGNVWNKTPFDHVVVYLTLADDSVAVLAPNYTGPEIVSGDLDGNGTINLNDYQTLLTNLQTTPGLPTRVENYRRGEITGDGLVNFADWTAFRAAYNAANGAGAFEVLLAQVPEPSSLLLLAIVGAAAVVARRRTAKCALAVALCACVASTAEAATLLKVDVNARTGEADPPVPPGDNTVAGFSPYTIDASLMGAQGTSTNTVDGYTITLTAVNADGVPTGVFDDRDRTTPTTAPTLNQLYDDFIFANATNTGEGGGLDMLINSAGMLMPNTQYAVSLYSFDTGSVGATRTANWLDGNNGNTVVLTTSFMGATSPTTDDQYKFDGIFRTDGSGNLLLKGRETTEGTHGVFLNGFEISDELPPPPVELTLRVNTTTGSVSIVNEQDVSISMSYYEIRSATGALNLAGWTSLDDAEGGDPVGSGWDEVPASSENLLNEVNLESMTSFAPDDSVSLGNAFTPGGAQNLQFFYAGAGSLDGDYNSDGTVDAADYVTWRKALASGAALPNDPTPGTTAEDYNVWRENFGGIAASETVLRVGNISYVTGAGAGLASSSAVPEPQALVLLAIALASLVGVRRSAA